MKISFPATLGIAIASGVLASAPLASAQAPSDIEDWLKRTLREAGSFVPPSPVKVRWKSTVLPMPPEVLDEWRRAVAGHPAHPLAGPLAESESRLKAGPDTISYTLWFANDNLWRSAVDQSNYVFKYNDQGIDGRSSWVMDTQNLELADAASEPGGPLGGALAIGRVRDFMSQGLTRLLGAGAPVPAFSVVRDGPGWTATFSYENGTHGTITGEWLSDGGCNLRELQVFERDGRVPKLRIVVANVQFDPVLHVRRAGRLETHTAVSNAVLDWIGAEHVDKKDVALRAAAPDPTGTDPVRGPVTVVQVNDLRGSSPAVSFKENDSWRKVTTAQARSDSSRLQLLGWGCAGLIIMVILGLRIRAARQA